MKVPVVTVVTGRVHKTTPLEFAIADDHFVSAPNEKVVRDVRDTLSRISLGSCFPLAEVFVKAQFDRHCLRMTITHTAPHRETGEQIRVVHDTAVSYFVIDRADCLLGWFSSQLRMMVQHEFDEGLRFNGQVVNDPHAKPDANRKG